MKPYIKHWTPEPGMTAKQIEKEVNRIAVLFEEEVEAGNEVVNQNIKFKDFIPQYMEIIKVRMSPLTLQFYDRIIDRLLIPYFGNKKLQDIKTAHVQGFINHLTKQFRHFLKKHGLKYRKLHSLRHTSATLLLYGGVNIRQVQARLGHSEIETTQKYLHYLTDADAEAANILTNMIEEDESHHIDIGMAQ